jgi:hypothetical protein
LRRYYFSTGRPALLPYKNLCHVDRLLVSLL